MKERIVKCHKSHNCHPCEFFAIKHEIKKGELAYVSISNDYFCKQSLLDEGWPEDEITPGLIHYDSF